MAAGITDFLTPTPLLGRRCCVAATARGPAEAEYADDNERDAAE